MFHALQQYRRTLLLLAAVASAASGIGLVYVLATQGAGLVADATLFFTIVAAVTSSASLLFAASGKQGQDQLAADVKRLAALTEGAIGEARAQTPNPSVGFLVDGAGSAETRISRRKVDRTFDVDAIVESERVLAMNTLPGRGQDQLVGHYLGKHNLYNGFLRAGPPTKEEVSKFTSKVDNYLESLRDWLAEYREWLDNVQNLWRASFHFQNDGRMPATDMRVFIEFPDPFEPVEEFPEIPDQPQRPRFYRPTMQDMLRGINSMNTAGILGPRFAQLPSVVRSNVSGPHYLKGSVKVHYQVDNLLHGVPDSTDQPALLRVPPGDAGYQVPWRIHAENMPEPTTGRLTLHVQTQVIDGPPVTTMDELLSMFGEPDDPDAAKED